MFHKLKLKTIIYLGGIFLLLALVFVLAQIVLAKNGNGGFQIKDLYIEIQETDYPQNIPLVKKENGKEEIAGQVKIIDQYLISELPENEFLEEFPELKSGFQDSTISLEADEPLFNKENFYHPFSLLDKAELKMKSLFGIETQILPEYRITKEIDKSQSVRTKLDLSQISLTTYYEKTEAGPRQVKQSLTLTNNSGQDLNLSLLLKNQIEANKIYWNNTEYAITETPQKFVNPDKISFDTENGKSFYDFSDVPDEFNPELWVESKNGQNLLILSLNLSLAAGETKTIDPTYGVEITILNVHSHPQAGDYWTVSFETKGTANLTITPEDQATIDDLDFISLKCGNEEKIEDGPLTILEKDVIFYPNWQCADTGEIVHLVNVARKHTLKFQFGDKIAYAYNNPDSVTDYFDTNNPNSNPEYYIASKENLVVTGGQVKLEEVWGLNETTCNALSGWHWYTTNGRSACWSKTLADSVSWNKGVGNDTDNPGAFTCAAGYTLQERMEAAAAGEWYKIASVINGVTITSSHNGSAGYSVISALAIADCVDGTRDLCTGDGCTGATDWSSCCSYYRTWAGASGKSALPYCADNGCTAGNNDYRTACEANSGYDLPLGCSPDKTFYRNEKVCDVSDQNYSWIAACGDSSGGLWGARARILGYDSCSAQNCGATSYTGDTFSFRVVVRP